jgi:hypothetical protein
MVLQQLSSIVKDLFLGVPSWGSLLLSPLLVGICAISSGDDTWFLFWVNAVAQVCMFVPMALLPCYLTRKKAYLLQTIFLFLLGPSKILLGNLLN